MTLNPNTLAMNENRVNWKAADVHHTSMLLPGPYREYLKGMIAFLNGTVLMEKVEAYDEVVLESFSDKQPRLPFNEGDLMLLLKRYESQGAVVERVQDMLNHIALRHEQQALGREAVAGNDELKARYHYAKDYALSYLIRGEYKMLTEALANRALPNGFKADEREAKE